MREILFRGKRIDNGEWVYGYWVKYKPYASSDKVIFGIVPTYVSELYLFEVDPETVGQFTGLYDCKGQKIFEGDILDEKGPFCGINLKIEYGIWNCGCCSDIYGFGAVDKYCDKNWNNETTCIIGNIYDNPELLEVKQNDK